MGVNQLREKISKLENQISNWKAVKKEAENNVKILNGNIKRLEDNGLINDDIRESYNIMILSEKEKIDEADGKLNELKLELRHTKQDERKVQNMITKLSNMGVEIVE